jgi:hypothetical protein
VKPGHPDVRLAISEEMRAALVKLAAEELRTVPNLVRKILAEHLSERGLLDRQAAVRFEEKSQQ